ncbi:hypothetical protein F0562_010540 [Nyssa sinensis]|uniref:non-specific serine/threonine protein kinase n=1 Tax=Nyssa sinensis TaxID=561372 RepID=A0A5J5A158_9ASTE|nr:hypothetical protein F0562_010540 [Nyssa sinensis]
MSSISQLSGFPRFICEALSSKHVLYTNSCFTSTLEALKQIGKTLGKTNWDFSLDPCSGLRGWNDYGVPSDKSFMNVVACNCSDSNGTLCHVTSILLKGQNLQGTLPPELVNLPRLQDIDLTRNYLNGTLPREWGSMQLVNISLLGNRLTGPIPKEFGNITTLVNLALEFNQLHLTSNNFTGELPETLAKLTTLKDFRIVDNNFTGKIPNFIGNWINLEKLRIQGSGLDGPIPPGIANLTNLTDLRISDLIGTEGTFPPLNNTRKLKNLILRSCHIIGPLPDYLSAMTKLKILDLSFNKLTGEIPTEYKSLADTDYIYLTGNMLNGTVPDWMLNEGQNIDLSYNNFTGPPQNCQPRATNLFKSYSRDKKLGIASCLGTSVDLCPVLSSSFHINCGGREVPVDENTKYEGDTESEIMFTDDKTYASLGRRIFDIYIQGERVRKDFNIVDKAGGIGKVYIERFTAAVKDSTLEIRFYWAGKGTTGIPSQGVYGPLISAIAVDPNFGNGNGNGTSAGSVVGIVAAIAFVIFLVLGILWWKGCLRHKDTMEQDLKGLDLQTGSFTLRQIKAATNNFDVVNKIGEGGFGSVYKVCYTRIMFPCVVTLKLSKCPPSPKTKNDTIIAVKQLSSTSRQGNREFVNEIGMISALQHPYLVKLYGCCIEGNQLLLVYEYMENNSLARALFGLEECQLKLDWPTRHRICIGIAKGLAYLHEESRLKIVHRDIKATNVLLDKNLDPKISDFGLAKLDEEDNTHISTRIAGTYYKTKEDYFYLLDWAISLKEKGDLMELVDPRLGSDFNKEEVMMMINVALLCTHVSPAVRPAMSSVVSMLEGRAVIQELIANTSFSSDKMTLEEMKNPYLHSPEDSMTDSLIQSMSIERPWTGASTSAPISTQSI